MIVTASLMDIRDIAAGDHTAPSSVGQTHKITDQNKNMIIHLQIVWVQTSAHLDNS